MGVGEFPAQMHRPRSRQLPPRGFYFGFGSRRDSPRHHGCKGQPRMASSDGFFSNLARNTLNARGLKRIFHHRGFRRRLRKNHPFILKFEQVIYRHFVNCECVKPHLKYGTRMLRFQDFSCAEEIRHSGYKTVHDGGWHFTFMGGAARISHKLTAYAHQERNRLQFTDVKVISDQIAGGAPVGGMDYQLKIVPLDETFPRYLLEYPGKFSSWIKE